MKTLYKILYGLFALALIAVAVLFFTPAFPFSGGFDVKIVKSGSMEPSIMTGGIVVIQARDSYVPGDVVTFRSRNADIPTTHRIISEQHEDGTTTFVTKGDANEDSDSEFASQDAVLGKVLFTLPYVGFVLDFARQPIGFGLLIVLPGLLIVIDEIEKIWREMRRRRNPVVTRENIAPLIVLPFIPVRSRVRMMDINHPVMVHQEPQAEIFSALRPKRRTTPFEPGWVLVASIVCVMSAVIVNLWSVGGTSSYFSDTEAAAQNTLGAGILDFKVNPDKDSFTFTDGELSDQGDLLTILAPEPESVPMKYSVSVEQTGGVVSFCNAIIASVSIPFVYNNTLLGLTANGVEFSGPFTLGVTLTPPGAYAPGDMCNVDIVYTGWNHTLTYGDGGYRDEERVPLTFIAPTPIPSGARMFVIVPEEQPLADTPPVDEPAIENPAAPIPDGSIPEEPAPEEPAPTEPIVEETPPAIEEILPGEVVPEEVVSEPLREEEAVPDEETAAPTLEEPVI